MSLGGIWICQNSSKQRAGGVEVLRVNPNKKPAAWPPNIMAINMTKNVCTSYFRSDSSLPPYQKANPEAGNVSQTLQRGARSQLPARSRLSDRPNNAIDTTICR